MLNSKILKKINPEYHFKKVLILSIQMGKKSIKK